MVQNVYAPHKYWCAVFLCEGYTLAQEARHFHDLGRSGIARRFREEIERVCKAPLSKISKGPYARVVDGVYFKFKRKEWVLYLMAVKPARSKKMYFLDPVLTEGRERLEEWEKVIDTIPPHTKK